MARSWTSLSALGAIALLVALLAGLSNDERASVAIGALLFSRPGSQPCVPAAELGHGPAQALRALSEAEIATFERDGSVVLKDVLSDVWVHRLQSLAQDVFEHPNLWDVLYSRLIANFYCAQKSLLVHTTSKCGRQIAEASPTTAIAAGLLRTGSLRVCEPNIALGNFRQSVWGGLGGCGTTGYHTDDPYIPVSRLDPERPAVVRLWIPLASFRDDQFHFSTLNTSEPWMAERASIGATLNGTRYHKHELLEKSGKLALEGHVISASRHGLQPGDVLAYVGETPHLAQARNCTFAGSCLRVILSYAGSNAVYTSRRETGLIPLHDNQTLGAEPQGVQFPTAWASAGSFKFGGWEWDNPLRPSRATLVRSLWHAASTGSKAFAGQRWQQLAEYTLRVTYFSMLNFWDAPGESGSDFKALSLARHFGTAFLQECWGVQPDVGERITQTRASMYLTFSALTIVFSAFMVTFFPRDWLLGMTCLTKAGVTLTEVEKLSPVLAMFMVSAGAGKFTAVLSGLAAVQTFCRFNLFATGTLVLYCCKHRDWLGSVVWGLFATTYAVLGFGAGEPLAAEGISAIVMQNYASMYLSFSAFTVVLSAFMVAFYTHQWLPGMPCLTKAGVTLAEVEKLAPLLAVFMLSSAAGKLTALLSGPGAVQTFCRLNLCATSQLVLYCCRHRDWSGFMLWGLFAVAYALVGFGYV